MDDRRFFCLRGFMKSGTNWLGSLLSSHEQISVVGEFHWQNVIAELNRQFRTLSIYEDENLKSFVKGQYTQLIKNCLVERAAVGATLIGERTPHTITPHVIPDAPVISIIRDGRDVLVSRAFHLHNYPGVHRLFERLPAMGRDHQQFKSNPWYFHENPHALLRHEVMVRESVKWWRDHLCHDRRTIEQNPGLKIRTVHYEDLHKETYKLRYSLFEFLEVDPKRAAKITGRLSPGFKNEKPTEFLRKGAVGDWKNYFTDDVKRWFNEEGGEELIQQGYVDSLDW